MHTSAQSVELATELTAGLGVGLLPENALSPLPLGCMEGIYMFSFVLLAQIGLHAIIRVKYPAQFHVHLCQLWNYICMGLTAGQIGLVPAKCFVSNGIGMHLRYGYVYICLSGPSWFPCHPRSAV